jgi:photosystem II stability/assembly factor-like uncharacterized protein
MPTVFATVRLRLALSKSPTNRAARSTTTAPGITWGATIVVGEVGMVSYDGSTPKFFSDERALLDVWMSSPSDVWIVGEQGLVMHGDMDLNKFSAWDLRDTGDLHAVHASTPNTVWIVGDRGTIIYSDGESLFDVAFDTTESLFGVWDGPSSAWAVGGNGLVIRYDANGWTRLDAGTNEKLNAVYGTPAHAHPAARHFAKSHVFPSDMFSDASITR